MILISTTCSTEYLFVVFNIYFWILDNKIGPIFSLYFSLYWLALQFSFFTFCSGIQHFIYGFRFQQVNARSLGNIKSNFGSFPVKQSKVTIGALKSGSTYKESHLSWSPVNRVKMFEDVYGFSRGMKYLYSYNAIKLFWNLDTISYIGKLVYEYVISIWIENIIVL